MKAARCTSEYFPDAISEMILSKASKPSRLPVILWRTSDREGSVGACWMPRSASGTAPSRFQAASERPASEIDSQSSSIWCSVAITDLVPHVTRILERDVRPSARQTGQSVRISMMASSWVCHFRRRAFRGGPLGLLSPGTFKRLLQDRRSCRCRQHRCASPGPPVSCHGSGWRLPVPRER